MLKMYFFLYICQYWNASSFICMLQVNLVLARKGPALSLQKGLSVRGAGFLPAVDISGGSPARLSCLKHL